MFFLGSKKEEQVAELKKMQLFRVMRLKNFLEWLRTGQNVLVFAEKWADPWERALFKQKIPCDGGYLNLSNFHYYGQCWTKKSDESEYMWRIYNEEKNICVRVEVNAYDLWSSFTEYVDEYFKKSCLSKSLCFCGNVKYLDESELKEFLEQESIEGRCYLKNFEQTLFVKRKNFSYENEFRIIFAPWGETCVNEAKNRNLFKFKMDASKIKSVLVQPFFNSNKEEREDVEMLFELIKKRIAENGVNCKIERSIIYDYPELNVKYSAK